VLVLALENTMKVNQVVSEHAKGMRAKKYARKPINPVAPKKPEGTKKPEAPKAAEKVNENYPKNQDLSGVPTEKLQAFIKKYKEHPVYGQARQVQRVRVELQRRSEAEVGEDATVTRADQTGTEITDTDTKVKTVIPPEMSSALAPDESNPNQYSLNPTAVEPGATKDPNAAPKIGARVEIKKAMESQDNELLEKMRAIAGLR
jgi:hypothetical protein